MTLTEKRLVEAIAARRDMLVSHLIRGLLHRAIREEMGERALEMALKSGETALR
jgi:hypothetical protein